VRPIERQPNFWMVVTITLSGIVIGQQADERFSVGVFLNAAFLKAVELLARLPVEVLAIHNEQAFFDVRVILSSVDALKEVSVLPLPSCARHNHFRHSA
jgi:hypothetical protein